MANTTSSIFNQQGKKIHHADAVSSSAGTLQIVKLYVQIKMWSVQDKNQGW